MFSCLLVVLFALLSLTVSSRPLQRVHSSLSPYDLPTITRNVTATPSSVPSFLPSYISSSFASTTDNCSEPTSSAPAPPPSAAAPTATGPTTTPVLSITTTTPPTASAASTSTAPPTPTTSPTTSAAPPTTAPPTTSATYTPATSTPVSTAAVLTTVSSLSGGPYTGGQATYFYQNGNPGACGQVNSDYAFICAMDQTRFGTSGPSSPLCGQQVQITNVNTGASITVTIADDCPTCSNENSIDLSVGAFQALAPLSEGVFPITWSYV